MANPLFNIAALFHIAREEARKVKIEQMRNKTMEVASQNKAMVEKESRGNVLDRMRNITNRQLSSEAYQRGVPNLYGYQTDATSIQSASLGQTPPNPNISALFSGGTQ
jgi:hypothetical protein